MNVGNASTLSLNIAIVRWNTSMSHTDAEHYEDTQKGTDHKVNKMAWNSNALDVFIKEDQSKDITTRSI